MGGVLWLAGGDEPAARDPGPSASSGAPGETTSTAAEDSSDDPGGQSTEGDRELGDRAEELAGTGIPDDARVLVVSVDGLASWAVAPDATPTVSRLLTEGAGTLNARTAYEQTVTLPNHTSMVTGERIDASAGGHGVDWNSERAGRAAPGVSSVFSVVDGAGGSSAVLAGKSKFVTWDRSWPGTIDDLVIAGDESALTDRALAEVREGTDLTFLHLRGPDLAGHLTGWGSAPYDAAVAAADAEIGRLVEAITGDPDLADEMVVVVTADHGGVPGTRHHEDPAAPADYTVPFVVWGAGVAVGDLYGLNPDYADPGGGRPSYDGPQPVRNGDVANLVTAVLGLRAVPGSEVGAAQDLDVSNFTTR
nr:alkaline phosphatase family protein [Nocardioides thalensis]